MSSINNDPIEQALIEQDPKGILLQTAIDISQFRANTAQGRNPYCKIQKRLVDELVIEQYRYINNVTDCQPGPLLESLFYIYMRQLNVPISVATGMDDMRGVDFYLFGQPIDVTSNPSPRIISEKLSKKSSTVICLPRLIEQRSLKQQRGEGYLLDAFLRNQLPLQQYLSSVIRLNEELKDILIQNTTHHFKDGETFKFKKIQTTDVAKLDLILTGLSSCLQ